MSPRNDFYPSSARIDFFNSGCVSFCSIKNMLLVYVRRTENISSVKTEVWPREKCDSTFSIVKLLNMCVFMYPHLSTYIYTEGCSRAFLLFLCLWMDLILWRVNVVWMKNNVFFCGVVVVQFRSLSHILPKRANIFFDVIESYTFNKEK